MHNNDIYFCFSNEGEKRRNINRPLLKMRSVQMCIAKWFVWIALRLNNICAVHEVQFFAKSRHFHVRFTACTLFFRWQLLFAFILRQFSWFHGVSLLPVENENLLSLKWIAVCWFSQLRCRVYDNLVEHNKFTACRGWEAHTHTHTHAARSSELKWCSRKCDAKQREN